jgi:uncharacterized membrane protein
MSQIVSIVQLAIAVLSIPVATGVVGWFLSRFSKERRLLLQLERLTKILPSLPEGSAKVEYGARVTDVLTALNVRLDPLFKLERRRKRVAFTWSIAIVAFIAAIANAAHVPDGQYQTVLALVLGGLTVVAFLLIERDTKRQRKALAQSKA